jgi:hypothetical protein
MIVDEVHQHRRADETVRRARRSTITGGWSVGWLVGWSVGTQEKRQTQDRWHWQLAGGVRRESESESESGVWGRVTYTVLVYRSGGYGARLHACLPGECTLYVVDGGWCYKGYNGASLREVPSLGCTDHGLECRTQAGCRQVAGRLQAGAPPRACHCSAGDDPYISLHGRPCPPMLRPRLRLHLLPTRTTASLQIQP